MTRAPYPDPATLAVLAAAGDRELRPVLLLTQARAFRAAGSPHDRRTSASFEALALGLIPLVTDDVVADVSAILNGVEHVPPAVRSLLQERRAAGQMVHPVRIAGSPGLDRADLHWLLDLADPAVDLALACNPVLTLDGHALTPLVERGRSDPALGRAMLGRTEPSALDRSALYVWADEAKRSGIRHELERALAVAARALPPVPPESAERLLALARSRRYVPLRSMIGRLLAISPAPRWRLKEPAEAELFALSLVAAGFSADAATGVLLTVDRSLASSVGEIFRLAQICRGTASAVAGHLVGAGTAGTKVQVGRRSPDTIAGSAGRRVPLAGRTRDAAPRDLPRPIAAGSGTGPHDHRSRSTRGRDRS